MPLESFHPLVADSLGLPLAGWLDPDPDVVRDLERGRPPAVGGRSPLAVLCRSLLAELRVLLGPDCLL